MQLRTSHTSRTAFSLADGLEIRRSATGNEVTGYAVTFGGPPNSFNEIVQRGAFAQTLRDHSTEGTTPLMLWAHHMDRPIGRWVEMKEDERGLFVKGIVNAATRDGADAWEHIKAGDVSGLSVGFVTPKGGRIDNLDGTTTLTQAHLIEVSVVGAPADRRARVSAAVSLRSKRELVEHLQNTGLARKAAARIAAGGWSALANETDDRASKLIDAIENETAKLRG